MIRLVLVSFLLFVYLSNASDVNIREGMQVYGKDIKNPVICSRNSYETETSFVDMLLTNFKQVIENVARENVDIKPLERLLSDKFEGYFFMLGNTYTSFDTDGLFWFMRYLHANEYAQNSDFVVDNVYSNIEMNDICVKGRIVNKKQITTSTFTFKIVREQGLFVFKHMSEYRKENV